MSIRRITSFFAAVWLFSPTLALAYFGQGSYYSAQGAYYAGQGAYYSQGTYYSQGYYQGTYYSQGYYQGYYQGAYNLTINASTSFANSSQGLHVGTSVGAGVKHFVIDDPLDPLNKLLLHTNVESPDVKNIYDGIIKLDGNGEAVVLLPEYFDALNYDVRYQLKPVGQPMPNLYVKKLEANNQFTIGGGAPGGSVSWQVTGIRHDPYILANPINPLVAKGPNQLVSQGQYLYPPAYDGFWRGIYVRIESFFFNLFERI